MPPSYPVSRRSVSVALFRYLCLAVLVVGMARASGSDESLLRAWQLGTEARFTQALAGLPKTSADENVRLTRAILLYSQQQKTAEMYAEGAAIFENLAEEGSTAEIRARSLYFWARSEDMKITGEDSAVALSLYERLWEEYPEESFGQRALVHLLLRAFYTEQSREDVLARVKQLEEAAAGITDRFVRAHFHQVAARGYLNFKQSEAVALDHLLAVDVATIARREGRGDLYVSIGQLAGELNRPAIAREHYDKFLQEFPLDTRAYTVRALRDALPTVEEASR